ncbi:MAG TPA: Holliday junction resolvase RuvX [Actinobacteria bacterium]|nr:Holliday junction resolvase RuvX [Actinomycetota bacterium]
MAQSQMSRIMAIDYGSKRLGVAVSDISGTLAQPVMVVKRTRNKQDMAILKKLAKEYDVHKIVIGYPLTLAGTEGPATAVVESFIERLREALNLPIVKYDERLSSKEAQTWLGQLGIRGQKARSKVDKVAATLVLQSYLDSEARGASS